MKKTIMKFVAFALAFSVALPNTVLAGCCGEVAAIQSASAAITGAITSSSQAIVRAVSSSADIQKDAQTSASADIAKASATHRAAISNVENESRARQDYMAPPDPCASYSVAVAGAAAREAVTQRSSTLQGQAVRENFKMPSASARAQEAVRKHKEKYCDEEDVRQKRCGSVSRLPSGDINAATVTTGAGKPGTVSPTFSAEQSRAAFDYTNNVVNAMPSPKLSPMEEKTPNGQLYVGMQLAEQAKLSLASQPFYDAIAFREPVQGLKARILAIWKKMAANGVGVPEGIKQSLAQQSEASYYLFLKTEIDRRVNNPQWLTDIMSASPASVNREMAVMQAQMLQMQFHQQMQLEQIAKVLGGLYAEQVQGNSNRNLHAMYNQVKKSSATSR